MIEEAIDNVSPGLSGDKKVDAELVAEEIEKEWVRSMMIFLT